MFEPLLSLARGDDSELLLARRDGARRLTWLKGDEARPFYVSWARGDAQAAWELFRQGLERSREVDDRESSAACLAGLAGVLGARG